MIRPINVAALFVLLSSVLTSNSLYARSPQIQNEAIYFNSLQEDLDWFEAAQANLDSADTRVIFLRVYQSVTLEMKNMFAERQFNHPEWVDELMLKYVSLYRNALECDISGLCAVSPAWQTAFRDNRRGKLTPAGQLLISISAHVNRDLPIALASIQSTQFDDSTYHDDFEKISMIFQRRMPALVKIVQEYQKCRVNAIDAKIIDETINFAIGTTREKSWNWAKKLSDAKSLDEENAILKKIEAHAKRENLSIYLVSPAPAFAVCL